MPSKWMTPTLTSDCLSENELHVSHKSTKPTYLAGNLSVCWGFSGLEIDC